MAQESLQKKLSRVRKPRVHITYDVDTGGEIEKRELPFVVGVFADLSGHVPKDKPLPPLKERKFIDIDRDNFDTVLDKLEPRLQLKVANRLSEDDTKLGLELRFHSLDEFAPAKVAEQVPALRKLLEARRALSNLRSSLIGNDKLESLLQEVLNNTEKLQRITAEEGIGSGNVEGGTQEGKS
jgi:type VI secretion system protein ImpB